MTSECLILIVAALLVWGVMLLISILWFSSKYKKQNTRRRLTKEEMSRAPKPPPAPPSISLAARRERVKNERLRIKMDDYELEMRLLNEIIYRLAQRVCNEPVKGKAVNLSRHDIEMFIEELRSQVEGEF